MTTLRDFGAEITYDRGASASISVGGLTIVTDPPAAGAPLGDAGDVGIALLQTSGRVRISVPGSARSGSVATPAEHWTPIDVTRPDGKIMHLTSIPSHAPPGAEAIGAEGSGFVLDGDDMPTIYVSGDNASLAIFSEIRERCGPMDVALLFAGALPNSPLADERLRLSPEGAAEGTLLLGRPKTVALNFESRADLEAAFEAGGVADLLTVAEPGSTVRL